MRYDGHDGRWDTCYSRTGFIVGGEFPRRGHSYQRYTSLIAVVRSCDLKDTIHKLRKGTLT